MLIVERYCATTGGKRIAPRRFPQSENLAG
jgi:hypothetical protein